MTSKIPHKFKIHRRLVTQLRKRIRSNYPITVKHAGMEFMEPNIKPIPKYENRQVWGAIIDSVDDLGYFDLNGWWHWNKQIKNIHKSHTNAIKLAIADMNDVYSEVQHFVEDISIKPYDRRTQGKWS